MAELVDALVSNTNGAIRAGSIPAPGTEAGEVQTSPAFLLGIVSRRVVTIRKKKQRRHSITNVRAVFSGSGNSFENHYPPYLEVITDDSLSVSAPIFSRLVRFYRSRGYINSHLHIR